ncbi:MAG TPA: PilZ domain-containing protein [Bryobacteraceae bacterium]|nr:PilZ domain-containing protein [Bryobacteraceae bacterium]
MVLELNRKPSGPQDKAPRNPVSRPLWPSPVSPHLLERRREARYPTSDPATVDVPYEKIAGLAAVVVDVSRSGLRLQLQQSIGRGMQVKITLSPQVVILGEVRYCRRAATGFYAGILVQESPFPEPDAAQHIKEDELGLYLVGKGLTVAEIIQLKAHLVNCKSCQTRLQEADAILNPVRKRRG